MNLGITLRAARERKGLSIQELSARTKIPARILHAIENNDFEKVPPGIYARSFLKSIALEVGADPSAIVGEFRAMTEPPPEPVEPPRKPVKIRFSLDDLTPEVRESTLGWSILIIAAAVLISLVLINRNPSAAGSEAPTSRSEPTVEPSAARPDAVVQRAVAPRTTAADTGIQIEMRAERICWVRAVVDGEEQFARLMYGGETATVTGQRDVVLRVGDPPALSWWVNGEPREALGPPNVPVTVRVGADGIPNRLS